MTVPLVATFSASCSMYGRVAPRPAVSDAGSAATVPTGPSAAAVPWVEASTVTVAPTTARARQPAGERAPRGTSRRCGGGHGRPAFLTGPAPSGRTEGVAGRGDLAHRRVRCPILARVERVNERVGRGRSANRLGASLSRRDPLVARIYLLLASAGPTLTADPPGGDNRHVPAHIRPHERPSRCPSKERCHVRPFPHPPSVRCRPRRRTPARPR